MRVRLCARSRLGVSCAVMAQQGLPIKFQEVSVATQLPLAMTGSRAPTLAAVMQMMCRAACLSL